MPAPQKSTRARIIFKFFRLLISPPGEFLFHFYLIVTKGLIKYLNHLTQSSLRQGLAVDVLHYITSRVERVGPAVGVDVFDRVDHVVVLLDGEGHQLDGGRIHRLQDRLQIFSIWFILHGHELDERPDDPRFCGRVLFLDDLLEKLYLIYYF